MEWTGLGTALEIDVRVAGRCVSLGERATADVKLLY
jgi:hypothetical protein